MTTITSPALPLTLGRRALLLDLHEKAETTITAIAANLNKVFITHEIGNAKLQSVLQYFQK
jgi:hypothetical protein